MKEQNFTFIGPDVLLQGAANRNKPLMIFDWDQAAQIIAEELKEHPNLTAEAGLQGDWEYTGGTIFSNGQPIYDEFTYLASTWAKPVIVLGWCGSEGN